MRTFGGIMPNESLEGVASKILTYTEDKYNQEYGSGHKYDIPTRLKQFEQRIGDFEDDTLYDIDTESVHEYLIRLDDDDLFTASAFLGHLLNPPVSKLDIPDYQRDYSWKTPNNLRYWIDIKSLLHSINDGEAQQREKYMGSAYVSDESDNLEIIDGQQRITTSLLLLLNIKQYLDLLQPHIEEADDEVFEAFFDYFIGSDYLEQMLYPSGGEPVLEPNESDKDYFNAIFAKEKLILERHLENIETTEGPGGVIGDEKLLRNELGYPPHEAEELSPVPDGENFVQKQSNRLLREAFTFYRERVGELIDQKRVLPKDRELSVNILSSDPDSVQLQAGSSSNSDDQLSNVPVGGAHIYYLPHDEDSDGADMGELGEVTYQGTTDAYGKFEVEFETPPENGGTIVVTSGYETEVISFTDISKIEPPDISIVSQSETELVVAVRSSGDGGAGTTVDINGNSSETDENGVAVFDLSGISPTSNDNKNEVYEITLPDGTSRAITSGSSTDSEYWPITYGDFESPVEKARILINLVFVLLHSIRIVYAEFGIPNKQYKIDIFQSLNDRGEDLDIRDLIRARVIAKEVGNADDWGEIDDRFDGSPDDIENFLKQYLTAAQGLTKPDSDDVKSLFALNEATVGNAESILVGDVSEAESKLEKLEKYSKRYEEISQASLPSASSGELQGFTRSHETDQNPSSEEQNLRSECEALFGYLNEVGKVWEPVVLGLYYNFSQTDGRGEQFNDILKIIVKIIYRYTPYGEGISSSIARTYLHDMAKTVVDDQLTVHDSDEIIQKLRSNLPEDLELEEVSRRFATRRNWQSETVKSLYARHIDIKLGQREGEEQYITRQFERTNEDNLTIEHIFPSSLGLDTESANPKRWLSVYFDPVDSESLEALIEELEPDGENQDDDIGTLRQMFVNDIGNMIPLIHAENASVSDRLFSKKLTYYFLVGVTEMKNTDEYLYDEHPLADVVPLIETFADQAGYDEDTVKKIFGLLVEGGDTAQQETISDALDEYSIAPSSIESTDLDTKVDTDSTVKDRVRSMLGRDNLDETASTVPDIVKDYNRMWMIENTKDRKEELVREMLATLAFEDEYDETDSDQDNFGIDLQSTIEDDYEKRVGLR